MELSFLVLITVSFGLIFNAVQSNTVAAAFDGAFKTDSRLVGLVMAGLLAVIIFGGVKRIARAVEMIVPVMAIIYVAVALFVVANKTLRQFRMYLKKFSYMLSELKK